MEQPHVFADVAGVAPVVPLGGRARSDGLVEAKDGGGSVPCDGFDEERASVGHIGQIQRRAGRTGEVPEQKLSRAHFP
jgi:hypothetical protein